MMNALYFVTVAPLLLTVAALTETSSTEIIRELEQCISHQEVNGCSIPFNSSFPYRNVFKTACNRHDVCYRCGVRFDWSRNDCDVGFLYDMYYACAVHGIKHKKKTRRSMKNTNAEKGETVKNENEKARGDNLENKKTLHHLQEDAETIEYAKEVNSKKKTADRNSAGKEVKRIVNERKEVNNSVKGKKSTTKKVVKEIDDAQELLAHDTASMLNALTTKEVKKDHVIEKKKSDSVDENKKEDDDNETKKEGKEGHELEQSAGGSAKRIEKEDDGMTLGEKGHKEKGATGEVDNLSFEKRKKERHAHRKDEDQWNAIIGGHGHSKEKHRKNHSSRKLHACKVGQNCYSHQPTQASTEKTEKSSLKMISNKYHEIEKMLEELNVLIKTEADKVEKKQNSNEEHSSKYKKSKEGRKMSGNTIEGHVSVNSTSLKDKAKNETEDDEGTHNETSRKTEAMKNLGNQSVEARKEQKAKSQKHHHGKELWEGKRRTAQKKEENDVIEKHSFDSTKNNHAMHYENDTVPKRKSFFVKCKLAAYMYFIAVRGFGQKFYREKPPQWCQHGCVKENGKPNLKRRRRPRGLE